MLVHVSTIIKNAENQILFVREAKKIHHGLWNLPGGHVEEGEHLSQAAIREVKEETGLDVALSESILIVDGISPAMHSVRFNFLAKSYHGEAIAGDEILELRWMTAQELLALTDSDLVGAPFLRAIIRDVMTDAMIEFREIRIS